MAQQIFISYSRVDSENTDKLIRRLKRTFPDFIIWHDSHLSSRGGQKWWDNILDGIEGSDIFLFLLSNESLASPYCQAEFAEAQRLERPFIAVQLRDRTQIPDSLADYQYINLANYKGEDDPYDDLVASINRLLPEGARAKRKNFPKKNRTPKPGTPEASEVTKRADVVTPPLVVPSTVKNQGGGNLTQYIIAAIGAIAVIFAVVITIVPAILSRIDDAKATQTVSALTQIAQAPTDTATVSPTPTSDPVDSTLTAIFAEMAVAGAGTATTLAETRSYLADIQATSQAVETAAAIQTQVIERLATQITWTPIPSPTVPTNTPSPIPTIPTNTSIPNSTIPTSESLEQALNLASTPVTSNAEWTPYIQEFNDVEMVLVPAGCFTIGANPQYDVEQNGNEICFNEPFWIDRYEVTQSQFRQFNGVAAMDSYFPGDNRPVEQITWFEARDFCELRDARLPTEAEWEYAARGPDELEYPWGDEWSASNVVWNRTSSDGTADVGSIAAGASWVGALDISGNVWEWVSSLLADYPYGADHESTTNSTDNRVLRGGPWHGDDDDSALFRTAYRGRWYPYSEYITFGFRCARSL